MTRWHSGRAVALPLTLLLALGGCVAVPVAQLAAQALATPGSASDQVAQAPASGMLQAVQGIGGALQRVTGGASSP